MQKNDINASINVSKKNRGTSMRVKAVDLAKYIVDKCAHEDNPISNLKLQKVLYNIQLAFLREYGEPAFEDTLEAWQYGPVVRSVYNEFWANGAMPIEEFFEVKLYEDDEEKFNFLNNVLKKLMYKNSWDLVSESHKEGTPWDKVYEPLKKKAIPMKYLREYAQEHEI